MARSTPADYREFIRLSVDLPLNPKLAMIDDPAAGWAYVVSLCYCGQNLTDGSFPMTAVQRLAGVKPATARKLVGAGLWHQTGHGCERCPQPMAGMAVVHDYLEHQRSAEEATALRDARREAGRKGAARRWADNGDGKSHGKSHAAGGSSAPKSRSLSGNGASGAESATGPVCERRTETATAETTRSAPCTHPHGVANAMASAMATEWQVDGNSMPEVEVEEELLQKTTSSVAPRGRKRPASSLPSDWQPNDAHAQQARQLGVDLAFQAEQFRNHAEANDRRQVRWDAAFRQWLNNAPRFTSRSPQSKGQFGNAGGWQVFKTGTDRPGPEPHLRAINQG